MNNIRIFGLKGSEDFASKIAYFLDEPLADLKDKSFEDEENYIRSDVNVRGHDVYVVSSMYSDNEQSAADKFMKYMFFVRSLVDASARRITAVIPYLPFARQDRKTESRAPINTKAVAIALEAMGVDRLLTMDVHNLAAFQNAFRIPTDNLEAKNLILDQISGIDRKGSSNIETVFPNPLSSIKEDVVIVAPDAGGMKRAQEAADGLSQRLKRCVETVYVDKRRTVDGLKGGIIVGNIKGKQAIVVDDMIASGSTILLAQTAVEKQGGIFWGVCCTHGLFVGKANQNLKKVKNLVVADTVSTFRLNSSLQSRIYVVNTAQMFAQAIKRIHEEGGSISNLLA